MKHRLLLLLLVLLLQWPNAARATAAPPAAGRPLAEALNPDGTLRAGAAGSFDARAFQMSTAPDGRPVFRPAGVAGAGDERWASGFGLPGNGVNGDVFALALAANGDVYIGGYFSQAGAVAASNVAKWNGTTWSSLGTGPSNGVNGDVFALAVASTGEVYVGGAFVQAGGAAAKNIAKWNGTAWSSLGIGYDNGVSGSVLALAVAGTGELYAGGDFSMAGGVATGNVAKWDGTAWSSMGVGGDIGVFGTVFALAVANTGEVYAGGRFTSFGSSPGGVVKNVAKWNGTTWSSLGTGASNGTNGNVYALVVASNGDVYAGGAFGQAGGAAANSVAKWNGTAWSTLGTGINGNVYALAVAGSGGVYVGGLFTQAGGIPTDYIARWNGTAWSTLGTGLNSRVLAVAAGSNSKLYVGGTFSSTGDGSKAMAHFGIYDPAAPLATAAAKAAPAAQLFPNPAHGTATLRLPATAARQPLTLRDALGRLVRQYPAPTGPEAVLDLRGLPAGVYVVRCGQLSQRLVVE